MGEITITNNLLEALDSKTPMIFEDKLTGTRLYNRACMAAVKVRLAEFKLNKQDRKALKERLKWVKSKSDGRTDPGAEFLHEEVLALEKVLTLDGITQST